jgi:hypothetical protein
MDGESSNLTKEWANNACTRLGVRAASFGQFSGFGGIPFRRRVHAPTPSG